MRYGSETVGADSDGDFSELISGLRELCSPSRDLDLFELITSWIFGLSKVPRTVSE